MKKKPKTNATKVIMSAGEIFENEYFAPSGMLVRLYNYYCPFDEYKRPTPSITGMYIKTGREAQFEFYEIAVIKDEIGKGGFVQRYLTSDFFISPITNNRNKPKMIGTNIGED